MSCNRLNGPCVVLKLNPMKLLTRLEAAAKEFEDMKSQLESIFTEKEVASFFDLIFVDLCIQD
jgi:hypothetical protein